MRTAPPTWTHGVMLSAVEMAKVAEQYEETPCTWLWSDYDDHGPNLLTKLLNVLAGVEKYLPASMSQPNLTKALRPYGITDFAAVPSPMAITGLATVWSYVLELLEADATFSSLLVDEDRPIHAAREFIPIRAGLVRLRVALCRNSRSSEALFWLEHIGWSQLLELADKRDHAGRELIAGRAFCSPEGGVAILPKDWRGHAAV